ncbi:MAG: phosphoadenylyl-sulfate reductase [Solirubrobacteraceae bacterium]
MTSVVPEFDQASAQTVLAYAVENYPNLKLACSFQKEESVLVHMLSEITENPRAFTIDTGVLFPQTLTTWKAFEDRFTGLRVEVLDARSPGEPWMLANCCSAAKVDALERALTGADAWVTGIRREQASTRAGVSKLQMDEKRGIWKVNPLCDWSDKDVWRYIFEHDLPYHPLHDEGYASIGCAPCTQPGSGREGRWSGQDKEECGIHE